MRTADEPLKPDTYNTKSKISRDPFGNVVVQKDLLLERRLRAAGAVQISEFIWELKIENR